MIPFQRTLRFESLESRHLLALSVGFPLGGPTPPAQVEVVADAGHTVQIIADINDNCTFETGDSIIPPPMVAADSPLLFDILESVRGNHILARQRAPGSTEFSDTVSTNPACPGSTPDPVPNPEPPELGFGRNVSQSLRQILDVGGFQSFWSGSNARQQITDLANQARSARNEPAVTLPTRSVAPGRIEATRDANLDTETERIVIRSIDGQPIDPNKTTWLVIHGRNSGSQESNIQRLAQAIKTQSPRDHQVLVLDWSGAAFSRVVGGRGEAWIQPVAQSAAELISLELMLDSTRLNLVGHSWGSYVANEIAERLSSVNTIVALDPARDYPGGFDVNANGQIDFAANSSFSWAFYARGGDNLRFGNPGNATTAHEAFVVTNSGHSDVITLFTNMISQPSVGLNRQFGLSRLVSHVPGTWEPDRYRSNGRLDDQGQFEEVVHTNNNHVVRFGEDTLLSGLMFSILETNAPALDAAADAAVDSLAQGLDLSQGKHLAFFKIGVEIVELVSPTVTVFLDINDIVARKPAVTTWVFAGVTIGGVDATDLIPLPLSISGNIGILSFPAVPREVDPDFPAQFTVGNVTTPLSSVSVVGFYERGNGFESVTRSLIPAASLVDFNLQILKTDIDLSGRIADSTIQSAEPEGESSWTNARNHYDVDADDHVTASDARRVINALNNSGFGALPQPTERPSSFLDVNADGYLSPSDARMVINELIAEKKLKHVAEGESPPVSNETRPPLSGDFVYADARFRSSGNTSIFTSGDRREVGRSAVGRENERVFGQLTVKDAKPAERQRAFVTKSIDDAWSEAEFVDGLLLATPLDLRHQSVERQRIA